MPHSPQPLHDRILGQDHFPQSYLDRFTYEEQEQDWRDSLSSGADDVLYVAETEAGEIVGYALGRPGPSEIPPYDGELVALHVRHSYQRLGIGQRLIAAIATQLMEEKGNGKEIQDLCVVGAAIHASGAGSVR